MAGQGRGAQETSATLWQICTEILVEVKNLHKRDTPEAAHAEQQTLHRCWGSGLELQHCPIFLHGIAWWTLFLADFLSSTPIKRPSQSGFVGFFSFLFFLHSRHLGAGLRS